jgi:outer membrane protein OmpA-like peptidoglycan-associated protein
VGAGVLTLTAGLAGCSGAPEPTGGLAIVVGAHSNMPAPELSGVADAELETAVVAESYLALVVADGKPFESATGRLLASDENDTARDQDREANRRMVRGGLADAAAVTPEVDLLGALDVAARSISSASGRHAVVVVDSGLSTVAPLDFTEPGMLDADPAELAASLAAAGELPALDGADVVFQGLGDTADPQPAIGRAQRTNLIAIWTAIAEAAGAGDVRVEESQLDGDAPAGRPHVSIVPPGSSVECTPGRVVLTGGDVAFRADSAEFVDAAAAAETLRPIAAQLATGGLTATVTGTTARVGDDAGQERLSRERAQAVADTLAGLGVPAGALTVVGLGSHFPEYVVDSDTAGNLVPAAAAANRKVVIDLPDAPADVTCARA